MKTKLFTLMILIGTISVFSAKLDTITRVVERPTKAYLDLAMYVNNPALRNFNPPKDSLIWESWTQSPVANLVQNFSNQVPSILYRGKSYQLGPIATRPFTQLAFQFLKQNHWAEFFQEFQPFGVSKVYITNQRIWIELQAKPWARIQGSETCEEFSEEENCFIYAQLKLTETQKSDLPVLVSQLNESYTSQELTQEEVVEWSNVLSSYWYPSYNTDLVPKDGFQTQSGIANPESIAAVFKSNPNGQDLYTILQVQGMNFGEAKQIAVLKVENKTLDRESSQKAIEANLLSYQNFLATIDLKQEQKALTAFQEILKPTPESYMTIEGSEGWLYFRKSLNYSVAQDIEKQARAQNPIPHLVELKEFLAKQNINLLVVPIPPKSAVYPEYLFSSVHNRGSQIGTLVSKPESESAPPIEHGLMRSHYQFLKAMNQAGVETLDFYPELLQAKSYDANYQEPVYQKHDTHWGWRGIVTLAEKLVPRVTQYSWYQDYSPAQSLYSIEQKTFSRSGDLIERLAVKDQSKYGEDTLKANFISYQSQPWKPQKNSPILLVGDSFTGVYELIDTKSAGIAAHLSYGTGLGVDMVTSWGGGPNVRKRMMRARKDLSQVRVVVYMMAARDFWQYPQTWKDQVYP